MILIVGDLHAGDKFSVCPPTVELLDGPTYQASLLQQHIYKHWAYCVEEWLPYVSGGKKFDVIFMGDVIEGIHHRATHQVSHNIVDHHAIFMLLVNMFIKKVNKIYIVRGTEAHDSVSNNEVEKLGRYLDSYHANGNYTHYEINYLLGDKKINCMHHISVGNRSNSELTALAAEVHELMNECTKWNVMPPDCVIRGHRHRHARLAFPKENGHIEAFVSCVWQAKTPFAYKTLGRVKFPHFGMHFIKLNKLNQLELFHSPIATIKPGICNE